MSTSAAPESTVCVRETAGGPCLCTARLIDQTTWRCDAGHLWYGFTPNVLKSTPWRFPRLSRWQQFRWWLRRRLNGECRHGIERRDGAWCCDCEGQEPF